MSVNGRSITLEALEARQFLTAEHPVAINFNDEALWDNANFDVAVAQAKALGVTAVRVWIGFNSYDDRPNAWDAVPAFGAVTAGTADPNDPNIGSPAVAMRKIFALKRDGFSVLLVTENNNGLAPASAVQVKGWIRHLMDATETPTSTQTLADVVDYWEIGNEPDSGSYWQPSAANKTTGLQSYVDNFLIPAAEELHSNATPEKVVSAGVSYNPSDLKTILDELSAKGAIGDIDYAGFHPYGTYNATTPSASAFATNTLAAKQYASAYGKPLMATEWNVRGFGNTGANNAAWAKAIDYEYRNVILPNYAVGYYFALVNNWAGRGGNTSARPGGLLTHNSPVQVTPSSSIPDLTTYFNSPLVVADPFYTTYTSWQMESVSGQVINSSGATPTTTVYIDQNNNGVLDTGEASTATNADGTYTLNFSDASVLPGFYSVRIAAPASVTPVIAVATLDLEPLGALSGVNFSVTPQVVSGVSTGVVGGTLWLDSDKDKIIDNGETLLAGWTVFLDVDGDGVLDPTDPQAVTDSSGAFAIPYDTALLATSTAALRVNKPSSYVASTPVATLSLIAGATQVGNNIGVYKPPASLSGTLWNDTDGNGLFDGLETATGSRVVFIDANGNGNLDSGEVQTSSDANGNYTFNNLSAGTYNITRVFPSGYHISNSVLPYVVATVTAGQATTGVNIGTTNKSAPVVTPPATSTASISGFLWNDVDGDGTVDNNETRTGSRVVFIDANGNGNLDSGEVQTSSDANGNYSFANLTAGTYNITRVFPSGYHLSNSALKYIQATVTTGQAVTGINLGTTNVSGPVIPPATGSISGVVSNAGSATPSTTVYIDQNNNGVLDTGEFSTTTATSAGAYTLAYNFANLAAGTYTIRIVAPANEQATIGSASVNLQPQGALTGVNFSETPIATPPGKASLSGTLWNDTDGNGLFDGLETATGSRVVFIDANGNGNLDSGEVQTSSDANGNYTFNNLSAGTYNITRVFPSGYHISNSVLPYVVATVTAGQATTGVNIGTTNKSAPVVTPPATSTASISGFLWNDVDGDGTVDNNETRTGSRVVFIDANGNGNLDSGEVQTSSDANGNYSFANLTAGTYNITRVFPSGYHLSNSALKYIQATVTTGQAVTGINLGTILNA